MTEVKTLKNLVLSLDSDNKVLVYIELLVHEMIKDDNVILLDKLDMLSKSDAMRLELNIRMLLGKNHVDLGIIRSNFQYLQFEECHGDYIQIRDLAMRGNYLCIYDIASRMVMDHNRDALKWIEFLMDRYPSGMSYLLGQYHFERDEYEIAKKLFERSTMVDAMRMLAYCYRMGLGCEMDRNLSNDLLRRSSQMKPDYEVGIDLNYSVSLKLMSLSDIEF